MSKILVTGATGHLGAAVTTCLLEKTDVSNVSILVRNPEKAAAFREKGVRIEVGDYEDTAALKKALTGIDKLYLVSGLDANRGAQHENVINAAKEAGVKHIVYTSFQHKTETGHPDLAFIAEGHLYTEKVLKASGVTYTILQHGLYAEVIPTFAGENLLQSKTIFLPAGEGKTAFATRGDMAEAGALVLLDGTGKFDNQTMELAGSETVSWREIAALISDATGETITYVNPSVADFSSALKNAGVPQEIIGLSVGFSQAISAGEFEAVNGKLEELIGRKPATVKEYLSEAYAKA